MGITLHATVAEAVESHRKRRHRTDILNQLEIALDDVRSKGLIEAEDIVLWKDKRGRFKTKFSTKETWEATREAKPKVEWYRGIWFSHATPKYSFLAWLAIKNRLTTGDRMLCWNVGVDPSCIFCREPLETRSHLFFTCHYTKEVWSGLTSKLLSQHFPTSCDTIIKLLTDKSLGNECLFLIRYTFQLTVHSIWKERNIRRHGETPTPSAHLLRGLDKQIRNRISSIREEGDMRKSNASKIDYLYEVEYVSDESKVPITQLPLLNPYKAFIKPNSTFPKVIKSVFGPHKPAARELVLASQLEQHLVPAVETEQMIPLRLNEGMIQQWRAHGYTHLQYGAIRLALTLHGRKGLPVVARVALLDTRYREYQHACIETIQTTLNAGTAFVTLYPNFNVALEDPQIYQNMQIQLQITGAPQIGNTYAATLHHQMVYRVQNHAMDLSLPRDTEDALLIQLESQHSPSCIHIRRQIPREELVKLLPESWSSRDCF
ncbi:Viral movement protein [Arabidopsis thaliana x Arabidopsis arenosa]|uniref:Viral movement protein n=1 Tax=Arabidopsis thaliana x Arabidopsis arenosa TaxID=1240361 RepID=A0A8T2B4L8_9BRAS|nr:Viral movement protein [Arabidopsis thaliana x Arabidopsis arenosa]